jgi:hypothetical protein
LQKPKNEKKVKQSCFLFSVVSVFSGFLKKMALRIDEDVEVIEVKSQREQVNVITTTSPKEKEREEIETFLFLLFFV